MIYLASPYTDPNPAVMEHRYFFVMDICQHFLTKGYHVVSPIVHCHMMAKLYKLPKDYIFWGNYNQTLITAAKEIWFALIPGYSKSIGLKAEFILADKYQIAKRTIDVSWINSNNTGEKTYSLSTPLTTNFLEGPE